MTFLLLNGRKRACWNTTRIGDNELSTKREKEALKTGGKEILQHPNKHIDIPSKHLLIGFGQLTML